MSGQTGAGSWAGLSQPSGPTGLTRSSGPTGLQPAGPTGPTGLSAHPDAAPAALPRSALAAVALPGGGSEVRELALRPCGEDDGWLRVEASGICGTDVSLHAAGLRRPTVLGHHVHGRIAEVGERAARRWGVAPGDRVVLEEYLPCGACEHCGAGRYRLCPRTDLWRGGRRVGLVPVDEEPALWGGNAQYLYLPPEAVIHPLPDGLADELAAWTLPLANALDWVLGAGALRPGETVVVLGPGYHGLAAVAAARYGGAGSVVAVGLPQDRARLAMAASLGATTVQTTTAHAPDAPGPGPELTGAEPESGAPAADLCERIARLTDGRMADVVLDLTGARGDTVTRALRLLAPFGRLVLAGGRGSEAATFDAGELTRLGATVRGVRGRAPDQVTRSIEVLGSGASGLEQVPTAYVALAAVGDMLGRLAAGKGPGTPHVVVSPWAPATTAPPPEDR